jgi:hypothetical protein
MTICIGNDADLLKAIRHLDYLIGELEIRIQVTERQLERLGAPQYRRIK